MLYEKGLIIFGFYSFNFYFTFKGETNHCIFSRLHIFDLWCAKKGSNANKLQLVIDAVQHNIENNGFLPELTDLKKSIGYIVQN